MTPVQKLKGVRRNNFDFIWRYKKYIFTNLEGRGDILKINTKKTIFQKIGFQACYTEIFRAQTFLP